jgi:thioester reductase-like protein
MHVRRGILLTGATGLLGRYLLKDLLLAGFPVAVLARQSTARDAADRVEEILCLWREALGSGLRRPLVLSGDLRTPCFGFGPAERHWLSRHGWGVVHCAACVSYQSTPDGEPFETNVHGTRRLLELCRSLGLTQFHHLSTAFVCGDRRGLVREDELDAGNGTANAYEQSKYSAEQMLRRFAGIRSTIYRPSVIVGDSRTGYTSTYHHFYRFLELAVRLSCMSSGHGSGGPAPRRRRQRLPVRLPLTGEEAQNLVPVDWVSRAVVDLLARPEEHGQTYHLAAWRATRLQEIKSVVEELLHLEGIEWVGPDGLDDPTALEKMILDQFRDYWSYLRCNLQFDCRNARRALAHLPPPKFDRDCIGRLLRFARADNWGRKENRNTSATKHPPTSERGRFLEEALPRQLRNSPLLRALPIGASFAIDICGPGGGRWLCCRHASDFLEVRRDEATGTEVTYRTDPQTFDRLIDGREPAQMAFFDGRISIEGDMEKGLKLAALIEQFLAEHGRPSSQAKGTVHAAARR